ncbi:Sua5/YciO/YrdC/YwlC family protein [Rheinheimera sp. MMS21-TC3]|uniref:Sua5/YciO/YrdC/YwlC family protein n=1 Tax=Rheinheimera sp. MMS21-TC3 TaxID=3072790 RepID=UPI0028C44134|nr:Sua5/YciO/YrdC/YwlC family protein [Rheinheimera sp. MMS21-TC3]WNO59710.1 Sua5/YciO/YrdC/YwlC family protein [Rheinheimera sp. MMS21-TC3]
MSTLSQVLQALHQQEVIAYPTEAVYGLGCDPDSEAAVLRLLTIKQRPVEKGLILIAANYGQLLPYIDESAIPTNILEEILASWPGHISWVVPASKMAPKWVTGQFSSIAVRVSAHPIVQQLCLAFGKPLVSTSANLSGQPAITEAAVLYEQMSSQVSAIMPGNLGGASQPSQIRNALTGAIVRS